MPELPEVETVVRGLRAGLVGARFQEVELLTPSVLRCGTPQLLCATAGERVTAVSRAGKFIVAELERGPLLLFHLGMTGQLRLEPDRAVPKHTHALWTLADGRQLRFTDPRRFGRLGVAREWAQLPLPRGKEPLEIAAGEFAELFAGRSAPIKNLLLNQSHLRGLGNIYADESLFRAEIHPLARRLRRKRLERLHGAVQAVLSEAIAAGGSSIADYVDSAGQPGWFQTVHRVYGREGEPCRSCGTAVRRLVLGGRSAHFCPRCQRR